MVIMGLVDLMKLTIDNINLWKCLKKFWWVVWWVGGLVDHLNLVSTPGPGLSRSRLSLFRLVTRLAKDRFGQLGDQIGQVKD